MTEYDTYFNISTNSLDTILLLHIITKYEIDNPTIDWGVVQEHLVKEYNRLKELKLFSSDNLIDSFKTEEDTKTFYNKIQDVFSKNHVNLELFLRSKRKELLKSKIEQLDKELKEKEDNVQLIKSNLIEQLQKDQQNDDKDQQQLQQSENESELVEVKEEQEDEEDQEDSNNSNSSNNNAPVSKNQLQKEKTNTPIPTTKSKRKHSALSTPQQTKEELDDEQQLQLQKKREEEQQKANNIKKILSSSLVKVWKTINSNRYAYIFRYPISKEDAPDYDSVIKHRMDLTTLKKKLDDNVYNSCNEFNKDLLLIFKNAMTYNEEDSDIYNAAVFMKKAAEKEMEACFATEELLHSGAANSLGTRSNRGPNTPSSSSSSSITTTTTTTTTTTSGPSTSGNTSGPSTPSLSTATMPSPSIRGRNKSIATPSTSTTRSSSKKNNSESSDQSNPNTPSLQEDSIDFSDDNNPTTPRSNKPTNINTPTSTSRSRSSAKKQAEAEAESNNSKKVSKRQRNSKMDETITHQDD